MVYSTNYCTKKKGDLFEQAFFKKREPKVQTTFGEMNAAHSVGCELFVHTHTHMGPYSEQELPLLVIKHTHTHI